MSECMDCTPKKMAVVERWALWRDGRQWRVRVRVRVPKSLG